MKYYKTTLNGKYSVCLHTDNEKEGETILSNEFNFKDMEFKTKVITENEYKLLNE